MGKRSFGTVAGWTLFTLLTLLLADPVLAQSVERRLELDDLRSVRGVTAHEISDGGEYVAYLLTEGSGDERPDLWAVPLSGGEPRRLDRDVAGRSGLDWSADSGAVAYLRRDDDTTELWTSTVAGTPRRACVVSGSTHSHAWVENGTRIAYVARAPSSRDRSESADPDGYRPLLSNDRPDGEAIYLCDVANGEVSRVSRETYWRPEFSWSPDGGRLVLSAQREPGFYGALESDLFIVDAGTGEATPLVERPGVDRSPTWSPDGHRVAFVSGFGRVGLVPNLGVAIVDPVTGRVTDVGRRHDRGGFFEGPYLHGWSSDGRRVHYSVADGLHTPLFRLSLDGDPPERLSDGWGEGQATHDYRVASSSDDAVAFLRSSENRPDELYVVADGGQPRALTDVNESLAPLGVPPAEAIRWTSPDGTRLEGILVRPLPGIARAPYPTVTVLHGGPAVAYALGYPGLAFFNPYVDMLLAAYGYAVFLPNPRGSGGYGEEFRAAAKGDWAVGPTADVLSGIDSLVARGIADPDRLGLAGWSYGGYLAAWILTQTDRFAAASVGAGVIDLTSHYGQGGVQMDEYFGGPPWRDASTYRAQSPIHQVAGMSTPVLIFHGTGDGAVSPSQSELLHAGLERLGVPNRFVRYPGEGHTIRGREAQDDSWNRLLGWLGEWLGSDRPRLGFERAGGCADIRVFKADAEDREFIVVDADVRRLGLERGSTAHFDLAQATDGLSVRLDVYAEAPQSPEYCNDFISEERPVSVWTAVAGTASITLQEGAPTYRAIVVLEGLRLESGDGSGVQVEAPIVIEAEVGWLAG